MSNRPDPSVHDGRYNARYFRVDIDLSLAVNQFPNVPQLVAPGIAFTSVLIALVPAAALNTVGIRLGRQEAPAVPIVKNPQAFDGFEETGGLWLDSPVPGMPYPSPSFLTVIVGLEGTFRAAV